MSTYPLEPATDGREFAQFNGVCMTAAEYFELPEDGARYELVHGVLVMSPSPMPWHQGVSMEISAQLQYFLRSHPIGRVFMETDVHLIDDSGEDTVYRPDVAFYSTERARGKFRRLVGAPNVVVEVLSPDSQRRDTSTKRSDYERAGVEEYWIIDPQRQNMTFLRLLDGAFVESPAQADTYHSQAIPGFSLDLKLVRDAFKPW